MKSIFVCMIVLFSASSLMAQSTKSQLVAIVASSPEVESRCLGFGCRPSALFLQQDTLMRLSDMEDILSYLNDSSYILKYYAFTELLLRNDSIAFLYLQKNISDSTGVPYFMADVMGADPFNHYLLENYSTFISARYSSGNTCSFNEKYYHFPPPDKKQYRRKDAALRSFLKSLNDQSLFELYYKQ